MLMYSFIRWRTGKPYDFTMIKTLMAYLWGIFILDFGIEMLEIVFAGYEKGHHWTVIGPLLR